jgi:hypothetical protein
VQNIHFETGKLLTVVSLLVTAEERVQFGYKSLKSVQMLRGCLCSYITYAKLEMHTLCLSDIMCASYWEFPGQSLSEAHAVRTDWLSEAATVERDVVCNTSSLLPFAPTGLSSNCTSNCVFSRQSVISTPVTCLYRYLCEHQLWKS